MRRDVLTAALHAETVAHIPPVGVEVPLVVVVVGFEDTLVVVVVGFEEPLVVEELGEEPMLLRMLSHWLLG